MIIIIQDQDNDDDHHKDHDQREFTLPPGDTQLLLSDPACSREFTINITITIIIITVTITLIVITITNTIKEALVSGMKSTSNKGGGGCLEASYGARVRGQQNPRHQTLWAIWGK